MENEERSFLVRFSVYVWIVVDHLHSVTGLEKTHVKIIIAVHLPSAIVFTSVTAAEDQEAVKINKERSMKQNKLQQKYMAHNELLMQVMIILITFLFSVNCLIVKTEKNAHHHFSINVKVMSSHCLFSPPNGLKPKDIQFPII